VSTPLLTCEQLLTRLDDSPGLVRRPLPPDEIESLERRVGLPAPRSVRAWLSKVGLFQDVSCVDACDFEVYEQPVELAESRRYILELLGQSGAPLFPFGHDGAGDEIAVRGGSADGDEDQLVFVDHETRTTRVIGSFRQWLADVVQEAVERTKSGDTDTEKFWCVQFTFQTVDEKQIVEVLRRVSEVTVPDSKWMDGPVGATGVRQAKLGFVYLGQARLLSRSIHEGWPEPLFALDYEEPVSTPADDSVIRRLDKLFRSRDELNYKLVDYGPLEWPLAENDDDTSSATAGANRTRPWWKFWSPVRL